MHVDQVVERLTAWWAQDQHHPPQRSWGSWDLPHRETLPQAVHGLYGKAVYEIGCGAGPNLRLLREKLPEVRLGGSDLNPGYVKWAREHLGLPITVQGLPQDVGPEWDITLSGYTMAYCPPDVVAQQLERIESQHLILMEPWGKGECVATGVAAIPTWYHDWRRLTGDTGWSMEWRWPIAQRNDLNSLTIFRRTGADPGKDH